MNKPFYKSYSSMAIASIMLCLLFVFSFYHLWHKNRMVIDAPSYYTYLPATFVYHDLHLNFIDTNPSFFKDKIWFYRIENNQRLIKHPLGWSLMLSPFFLLGHAYTLLTGGVADGYSYSYQNAVSLGILFYLCIGLYYLRKYLLHYCNDKIVAIVIFTIVIGTNLLWYSTFEGFMPHALSFSILCVALYYFEMWLISSNKKQLYLLAFCIGISLLIRPLAITILLYFSIALLIKKQGIKNTFEFIIPQLVSLSIAFLIITCIVSLQFCYWKYATGHWLFDVYIDEHFVFSSPQVFAFLFSFRKGVFIYTPILLFAIVGLVMLIKKDKAQFYAIGFLLIVSVFVLSSWWAWSYGICWAMRPMIDYFSFLSLPLAIGFSYFLNKNVLKKIIFSLLITMLVLLNLFQTWQYKNGLLHYDDMTYESYKAGFFQTKASIKWLDALRPYNWQRRINHLPQIEYSRKAFEGLKSTDTVWLRAYNLQYVSVNDKAQNIIAAYKGTVGTNEKFFIKQLSNNTICIQNLQGYYLSVKTNFQNIVAATEKELTASETFRVEFISEEDNRFRLKAFNGKYLRIDANFPFLLKAEGTIDEMETVFRYFVD